MALKTLVSASLLLAAALPTSLAAAQSTPQVTAPPARGASASSAATVTPSLFNGAANLRIPFEIAPGRAGTAPTIGIRYSSDGEAGLPGLGWAFELGTIRNNRGRAVAAAPFTYDTAEGSIDLDESGRLLHHSAALEFSDLSAGGWRMRDSFGNNYLFGVTPDARVETSIFTAEWHIEQYVDRFGNRRDYRYAAGTGHLQPVCIEYGANGTSPHTAHVEFTYEPRPDRVRRYRNSQTVEISNRLIEVASYSGGGCNSAGRLLYSRYRLKYSPSPSNGTSLLIEIERIGVRNENQFRPLRFTYDDRGGGWDSVIGSNPPRPTGLYGDNCITVDFNGNGRSDLACQPKAGQWIVGTRRWDQIGGGVTFSGPAIDPVDQVARRCSASDFTGDGKDDFLCEQANSFVAAVSTGTGVAGSELFEPSGVNSQNCLHSDANADGRSDMYCYLGGEIVLFEASESGWRPMGAVIRSGTYTPDADIRRRCTTGDFWRGDGRVDVACYDSGNKWLIGTTSGEVGIGYNAGPMPSLPISRSCLSSDFTGDGVADFACTSAGGVDWLMYIGQAGGSAGFISETWTGGANARVPLGDYCTPVDINADGIADIACKTPTRGEVQVARSTGNGWLTSTTTFEIEIQVPIRRYCVFGNFRGIGSTDLLCNGIIGHSSGGGNRLIKFENSLGGSVAFGYSPVAEYWDNGSSQQLGVAPMQVLSRISSSDGLGNSSVTSFDFDEGYFDALTQEFRGFGHVTVNYPANNQGEWKRDEHWFLQGDSGEPGPVRGTRGTMKGRPYRERTSIVSANRAARLLEERRTKYHEDPALGYRPIQSVTTLRCESGTCEPVAQIDYRWDRFGNMLYRRQWDPSEKRAFDQSTRWTYINRADLHIVSLPASETRFAADGKTALLSARFGYGPSTCSGADAPSEAMALTKTELIAGPGRSMAMMFGHDRFGNRVCNIDAVGGVSTFEWDPSHTFQTATTRAVEPGKWLSWRLGYYLGGSADGLYGQLAEIYDPAAVASGRALATYRYDDLGRLVSTSTAGATTSVSYADLGDPQRQKIRLEGSAGLFSEVRLDGSNRPIETRWSGAGSQILKQSYRYDDTGRIIEQSYPGVEGGAAPASIAYSYDGAGRLVEIKHPDKASELRCHKDLETIFIDARGEIRRHRQDGRGAIISVEEYSGLSRSCELSGTDPYGTFTFLFDELHRLSMATDANGVSASVKYDGFGRPVEISDPYAGLRYFTYDAAGRTASVTDAEGRRIEMDYDLLGRITERRSASGKSTYRYDLSDNTLGRLASLQDPTGSTAYGYDAAGRIGSVEKTVSGRAFKLGYSYDVMGRPSAISYPSGKVATYTYRGAELESLSYDGQPVVTLAGYDEFGRALEVTYGNGLVEKRLYGSASQAGCMDVRLLCRVDLVSSGSALASRSMTYDSAGNLVATSDQAGTDESYQYDALGRLVQKVSGGITRSYRYDRAGNITFDSDIGEFVYPAPDAPLPYAATNAGNASLFHDRAGNLVEIKPGSRSTLDPAEFIYDGDGRLADADVDGSSTRFKYDAQGRRSLVGTDLRRVGNAHRCHGSKCVDTLFVGTTVVAEVGPDIRFRHGDQLGSTIAVTDAGGALEEKITYGPFGQPASSLAAGALPWRFGGQFAHAAGRLYENGARFFYPGLSRFLTPDFEGGDPRRPQSLNRYTYALNRPTGLVDATGFMADDPDDGRDDDGDGSDGGSDEGGDDGGDGDSNEGHEPHPDHGNGNGDSGGGGGSNSGKWDKWDKGDKWDSYDGTGSGGGGAQSAPPPPPPPPPGSDIGPQVALSRTRGESRIALVRNQQNPFMRDTALPHIATGLVSATIGYLGVVTLSAAALTPIGMVLLLGSSMALSGGIAEFGLGLAELGAPEQRETGNVKTALMLGSSPLALVGGAVGGVVNGEHGLRTGTALGFAAQTVITFDKSSALQGATFYLDSRTLEEYVRSSQDRDGANMTPLP